MSSRTGILALTALLLGCASFNERQVGLVEEAVRLQDSVLADPSFAQILTDLESRGEIEWDRRLEGPVLTAAGRHGTKVAWLLSQYRSRRGYKLSEVLAWRKLNPFSSTTAATYPGRPKTRLNLWRLKRDSVSVANTLVHERTHSFGLVHPGSQSRGPNLCDAAYVAGDLAELLLTHSGAPRSSEPETPVCPALCRAAARRRISAPCAAAVEAHG